MKNDLRKKGLDEGRIRKIAKGKNNRYNRTKDSIRRGLDRAKKVDKVIKNVKKSTASMGKFDHKSNKEIKGRFVRQKPK